MIKNLQLCIIGKSADLARQSQKSFNSFEGVLRPIFYFDNWGALLSDINKVESEYCLVVNAGETFIRGDLIIAINKIKNRIDLSYVYFSIKKDSKIFKQKIFDFADLLQTNAYLGPILFKTAGLKNFNHGQLCKHELMIELALLGEYGFYDRKTIFEIQENLEQRNFLKIKKKYRYLFLNIAFLQKKWSSSIPWLKRIYRRLPIYYRRLIKVFFYRLIKFKYLFNSPIQIATNVIGPKISIIVPVYNHPQYLRACFDSALEQSYQNFELVLVDDCSTDPQVRTILEEYSKKDKVKVIYNKKNLHVSKTLNIAISNSVGEYIAFLDCDDELFPYSLQEIVKNINNQKPLYLSSRSAIIDEKGSTIFYWQRPIKPQNLNNMWASHFKVLKKELFYEIGLHDPWISGIQDYDLALKTEERFEIDYVDEYLYKYREHAGTVTLTQLAKQYKRTDQLQFRSLFRRYLWSNKFGKPELKTLILYQEENKLTPKNFQEISQTTTLPLEFKSYANQIDIKKILQQTSCDFVYLMKENFIFQKNWLEFLHQRIAENFGVGAVCSCLLINDTILTNGGQGQEKQNVFDFSLAEDELSTYDPKDCDWTWLFGTLFRTQVLLKSFNLNGLQNKLSSEDLDGFEIRNQRLSQVQIKK